MIDIDKLLVDILKKLERDSTERKILDEALKEQNYVYNEEGYLQAIHTNPLYAACDDPTIFKIGDIIRNKHSGVTAEVTTYLDGYYGLSNGYRVPARNKDSWKRLNEKQL